ncbi:hypothetical protein SteCoe_12926 [Stentor coeruleus]|uniref:Uncharacterized protein n=1 Tax=Stentor coeruleus TaxID=5963 RepID=A0A1R2C9T2_9CILI|nr:hypothetical protein SteCoe_12926 [Stentor coeruleus]
MADKISKAESSISLDLKGNMKSNNPFLSTQRPAFTEIPYSEGFRFSFSEPMIEDHNKSFESTESLTKPLQNFASKSKSIVQDLNFLQTQIKSINCRISQNLKSLQEKQAYNQKLTSLILKYEQKIICATDKSFIESKCLCKKNCQIL